jgi:acetylornithine deacetylase/succinyl-diaminopimelate desuccinylase-like protein
MIPSDVIERIRSAVDPERLLDTAVALVGVPSPTREAGAVADLLAERLKADGFAVERPVADWPEAPAVVVRWRAAEEGPTLQFDGHLDTVHLPYVPPRIENGVLYGQGSADMKGGLAAAVEAVRALRDADALRRGGLLLTAHDHHEGPWGDSRQVHALIDAGYLGDGVLIPEYLADRITVAGRGQAVLEITVRREGERIHEVLRPPDQPDVIEAGAEVVRRLKALNADLARTPHPYVGPETVFVGQIHSGEMFNQSPVECRIAGTRRWVSGHDIEAVKQEFLALLARAAQDTRTVIEGDFIFLRDGFRVDENDPLVAALQAAHVAATGNALPLGAKPFVDDGNSFTARGHVPALSHGPAAEGAHTTNERVRVAELVRVAQVYALAAVAFCGEG